MRDLLGARKQQSVWSLGEAQELGEARKQQSVLSFGEAQELAAGHAPSLPIPKWLAQAWQ